MRAEPSDMNQVLRAAPRRAGRGGGRAGIALAALLALAGCAQDEQDAFPPPCPNVAILSDAADLVRARGGRRDITDMVLAGRITGVSGSCKLSSGDSERVEVAVRLQLTRGPAMAGRTTDVPYFVAVSQGERILDKAVRTLRAHFPENQDRLELATDPMTLHLPVSGKTTAAAYTVWVGFQLTPEEMAHTRAAAQ